MSTDKGHRNRLAQETSPYLRQHETNPVDWYPWGEEALARAKAENKPILLSVGYSACHWCHVMAHESFEDEGTAALMNQHFINVKVDREERPDLDQLYQGVVQLMGKGGGWPLTVFLTPDLRPFYGGTYFPPADRYGMPGFPKLLAALHDAWTNRGGEVEAQANQFREGLGFLAAHGLDAKPGALSPDDVVQAARKLEREVDPRNGGFGGAPKFPNPMNVALLLRGHRRSRDEALKRAALLTLDRMARGGIYDQLGGGFHRYAVDERWLVPHFEKMLYDNAQLLHLYSEAEQLAPDPLWRAVVVETVAYLEREMTAEGGAFFAAQDADSEGEEGKFFVWTPRQLAEVLSPREAELISLAFGVTEAGNFEHRSTVLERVLPTAELARRLGRPEEGLEAELAGARAKLLAARRDRVAPGTDDKVLAGWNGLAIRGLAFASRVFDRPDWARLAARAADFVLENLYRDGRLSRSYSEGRAKIDAFLEDYGDLAAGLVALYQATFEPKYLEAADRLATDAVRLFWDEERAAYLSAPKGQKDLLVPTYALHDNAYPSGASTLTEAQVALAGLTGRASHLEQAERYLARLREPMVQNPFAFGHLWLAADAFLDGAAEVTIAASREESGPWLRAVNGTYAPTVAVALRPDGDAASSRVFAEGMAGRDRVNGAPAAYLCRHFACERPILDPGELRARLLGSGSP